MGERVWLVATFDVGEFGTCRVSTWASFEHGRVWTGTDLDLSQFGQVWTGTTLSVGVFGSGRVSMWSYMVVVEFKRGRF